MAPNLAAVASGPETRSILSVFPSGPNACPTPAAVVPGPNARSITAWGGAPGLRPPQTRRAEGPTQSGRDLPNDRGDEGFMLLTAIVMIFMVLLVLSVAAPRVAREIQRDREQESARRAQQYVRAVRIFYLKFKRYPTSIEQLEKTNNQRFLRQRYVDPLTGKDDWRLIHVGENQTTVKGFFGEDLPGLPTGLGAAANMTSPTSNTNSLTNSLNPQTANAQNQQTPNQTATNTPGIGNNPLGSASSMASQGGTDPLTGGGGPIIGIGSARSGEAMLVVNEQTNYNTWEFLYDPRIEQLYAKANLLGGISSGSGMGTGLGTASNLASPGQQSTPITPNLNPPQTSNPPPSGP